MTCSRRTRRWKVLPEKQNPNEQTDSLSHWAHDQWGYWKLSLHSGSLPKFLLLHLRGPTYFCWHGTRMVSWGGSDIQVCGKSPHPYFDVCCSIFIELWLCCSALAESSLAGLSAWLVSSLMTWAVHQNCARRKSQVCAFGCRTRPLLNISEIVQK